MGRAYLGPFTREQLLVKLLPYANSVLGQRGHHCVPSGGIWPPHPCSSLRDQRNDFRVRRHETAPARSRCGCVRSRVLHMVRYPPSCQHPSAVWQTRLQAGAYYRCSGASTARHILKPHKDVRFLHSALVEGPFQMLESVSWKSEAELLAMGIFQALPLLQVPTI